MHILLSQVPPEGLELTAALGPDSMGDLGEGVAAKGEFHFAGRADPEGGGLRLRGHLEGVLEVACSRCLSAFSMPVANDLDVTFQRIVQDGDEVELGERDMVVCHLEGDRVNVGEAAREQVLLDLPMAPVCADGCKGICPRCGADLNRGACDCAPEASDPRFAALKKLLEG